MNQRKLRDLEVSAIGLGCMGMSAFYGSTDEAEGVETIRRALELGVDFIDTAQLYGPLTNESLVGTCRRGAPRRVRDRDEVQPADGRRRPRRHVDVWDRRTAPPITCVARSKARSADSARTTSTSTTNTESIRTCRSRRPSARWPSWSTEGKIRHIGLSEAAADTIRRANAVHPIAAVQTEYSLWSRDPEDEVLPTCRELGIGFVALLAARSRFPRGAVHFAGRARRGRLPPYRSALHRRQSAGQPAPRRQGQGNRCRKGRHAGATSDRVAARAG